MHWVEGLVPHALRSSMGPTVNRTGLSESLAEAPSPETELKPLSWLSVGCQTRR